MQKLKNQQNFQVPPLSREAIRQSALSVRTHLRIQDDLKVDFLRLIELVLQEKFALLETAVESADVLGDVEAITVVRAGTVPLIILRQDVYDKARDGDARAFFTIGHELGHVFLHSFHGPSFELAAKSCPVFEQSEWQANEFAAELLAPAHLIKEGDTINKIIKRFGVSKDCAIRRLKNYNK